MKVTLNPDGTVSFDVVSADEALDLADRYQKREPIVMTVPDPAPAPPDQRMHKPTMNALQFDTWQVLYLNDCEEGVHIRFVAEALKIGETTVGQRLQRLAMMGHAKRCGRGHYRAL